MNSSKLSQALRKALIAGGAAVFTLAALPMATSFSDAPQIGGSAWAAEDGGHSGGHSGGGSHGGGPPPGRGPSQGHGGDHGDDHGDEEGSDHGEGHASQGKGWGRGGAGGISGHGTGGRGGEGHGGEGHVPRGTGRSGREGGGPPVWAREGIPDVELGRLNVSRAPAHVLDRALNEAVNEYDPAMTGFYSQDAESAAAQLAADYQNVPRIDSPLQNLALYKQVLNEGGSPLPGVTPASTLDMAAIFLGSASDKGIPVSSDTVTAVNAILGLPAMSPADTAALAAKAEAVRSGIATGHGP